MPRAKFRQPRLLGRSAETGPNRPCGHVPRSPHHL